MKIPVYDPADSHQLIGRHAGVTNNDHPIFFAVGAQNVFGVSVFTLAATGIMIQPIVNAIMKIKNLKVFKMIRFIDGGKKLITEMAVGDHRSARIHQQQHFHPVYPGALPDQFQPAGVLTGLVDGAVQIQFILDPVQAGSKLPQFAKRDLKLSDSQRFISSEFLKSSHTRYFYGGHVAGIASHSNSSGMIPGMAKGGRAAGTYPAVASIMLFGLLSQSFFQHALHFVHIDLLVIASHFIRYFNGWQFLVQPFPYLVRQSFRCFYIAKIAGKSQIKTVIVSFGLDQNCPAKLIKTGQTGTGHAHVKRFHQRLPFIHGYRYTEMFQIVIEFSKHRGTLSLLEMSAGKFNGSNCRPCGAEPCFGSCCKAGSTDCPDLHFSLTELPGRAVP